MPAGFTIPLRTPFALTGSATDAEGDPLVYSWEQNDQGNSAPNANGQSLLNNVKTDGPLFAMFPKSAPVSEDDTLEYESPGENHLTTSPTRVFPDLAQILANNTNAETGVVPVRRRRGAGAVPAQGVLRRVPADGRLRGCRRTAIAALPVHGTRSEPGRWR